MTKDEALKMCLEYIEANAHERKYVRHAIKEALSKPSNPWELEPVAQKLPPNCGTGFCSCIECVMEPAQQPVRREQRMYMDEEVFYTSPPQRLPLTDEEISKLADDFLAYQIEDYRVSGVFTFARAIEAAHGIGDKK